MNCPVCKTEFMHWMELSDAETPYWMVCPNPYCVLGFIVGKGNEKSVAFDEFYKEVIKFDHNLVKE